MPSCRMKILYMKATGKLKKRRKIMAKGQKKNKSMSKKKPQKTLKEKRQAKKDKKNNDSENILNQLNR